MGICGVDQATSLDMLVLQNEVISYVESTLRQIDFGDEALGLDVIEEVGPGGSFIDRMHTARHFRKELWFPQLLDREYYQAWIDQGARSTEERCAVRKDEILKNHAVEPPAPELSRELDRIVASAEKELGRQ
jgi:trimethylamine--corrinoid protein Co-methyltransferase